MGKTEALEQTETQHLELKRGFRLGESSCFHIRCCAVLLKADGLSSAKADLQTWMCSVSVKSLSDIILVFRQKVPVTNMEMHRNIRAI